MFDRIAKEEEKTVVIIRESTMKNITWFSWGFAAGMWLMAWIVTGN